MRIKNLDRVRPKKWHMKLFAAVPFGYKSRVPGSVRSAHRTMRIQKFDRVCPKKWHVNFGPAVTMHSLKIYCRRTVWF
jgi:hypothetical protein